MNFEAGTKENSVFAGFHPVLNYLYFAYVALITVFFLQPALLIISLVSAFAWSVYLGRVRALRFGLMFVAPLMLVAAAFNPAFNHEGVTILWYLRDNPITLESIIYGVCAAAMIGGVIFWFSCYNAVMTSDKFIYLFGRDIPAMSLIISMALRFIPRYAAQTRRVASARRSIGMGVMSGGFIARVKSGGEILSVMVTWALENAVETSDSMRSRGYGLKGRTAYSIYRFDSRDRALLLLLCALMAVVIACALTGSLSVEFFPMFEMNAFTPLALLACACHTVLCLLPLALDLREDAVWRLSKSKI
jgi:energy-coupling factor transport system permease protein